jgi:RNA polymerase sigma-B factor
VWLRRPAAAIVRCVNEQRKAEQVREWFTEYARTGERRYRDRLVEAHIGLAYAAARRFVGRGEDLDDLRQVALMALLGAVERFDTDRGVDFGSFATTTIYGALKRHLRDHTWVVRPPRHVQERYLEVSRLVGELASERRSTATVAELSERTSWSETQVREALCAAELRRHWAPSIDDDDITLPETRELGFERVLDRQTIATLTRDLPPRVRQILELRFGDDLTQAHIAAHVDRSQTDVSRVLLRTMARLRAATITELAS